MPLEISCAIALLRLDKFVPAMLERERSTEFKGDYAGTEDGAEYLLKALDLALLYAYWQNN